MNYIESRMKQILNKPYRSIWIAVPVIISLSLIGLNGVMDVQMHDTYFVISLFHVGVIFSLFLGLAGFIYWLFRKRRLVNWMTVTHIAITISAFVLVLLSGLISNGSLEVSRSVNQFLLPIIILVVLSQLIFIVNLIIALIRKKRGY